MSVSFETVLLAIGFAASISLMLSAYVRSVAVQAETAEERED